MVALFLISCLLPSIAVAALDQDAVSKLGELADVEMGIDPVTDVKVAKSPRSRQPKLFFISSTTSTTIFTTSTFCYVTSTTTAMATCKKRRAIVSLGDTDSMTDIKPMKSSSSDNKEEEGAKREGRWLNYWITTTITTMTTSFTATATIASVICTPYGYTVSVCPSG